MEFNLLEQQRLMELQIHKPVYPMQHPFVCKIHHNLRFFLGSSNSMGHVLTFGNTLSVEVTVIFDGLIKPKGAIKLAPVQKERNFANSPSSIQCKIYNLPDLNETFKIKGARKVYVYTFAINVFVEVFFQIVFQTVAVNKRLEAFSG